VVERSQRERLFAAMVATVANKGYEATRVADLLELSGVSRSAFYEHFADKQACFLAAVKALMGPTLETIARGDEQPLGTERARKAFDAFIKMIVDQPAAARMCLVEIYAAGPEAVEAVDRTMDVFGKFTEQTLAQMPGRDGMPREIVRGIIGGLRKTIHTRLYRGEEAELTELAPQMWEWGLSYLPPPARLRKPRRRAENGGPRPQGYDQAERLLRAVAATVAELGYPATTVGEIAARAQMSLSTFYAHFDSKEEAMLAAVDSGSAQMLATTLPAFRRGHDWPHAVRSAFGAMFAFGAAEPEFTQLGTVEVYAAGKRALEQRDRVMEGLEALLAPGYERFPGAPPIAAEAIGGAIYSLIYDQVKARGPESLPQIAPLATYMTLAPFVGAHEACLVANSDGRGH